MTFTPEYLAELEDAGVEFLVRIGDADVWIVPARTDPTRPEITYRALATLCDAAAAGFKPLKFVVKPQIGSSARAAAIQSPTEESRKIICVNSSANGDQKRLLPSER